MSQTTIAPIYTKKHLQPHSMLLFPVASFFRTIKIKYMYAQKSKFCFWMRKGPMSFSFSVSLSFFSLRLFLLFSSFLLQFLAYFWACFQIRNFQKFLQKSSQVYLRESFLSNFWAFLCIFLQVHLMKSLGIITYHQKELEHKQWQFCSKVITSE